MLNADTVRILREAQCPATPAACSNAKPASVSAETVDEEFQSFAAKKKVGKRGTGLVTADTAEPKTKGKRKATDIMMDTSK